MQDRDTGSPDLIFHEVYIGGYRLAGDIKGVVLPPSGFAEFTPAKVTAIHRALASIQEQLQQPYTPQDIQALIQNVNPTDRTLTKDPDARQYRGVLFSDVLIAAIVNEGKFISSHGHGATSVVVTPSAENAASFSLERVTGKDANLHTIRSTKMKFKTLMHLTEREYLQFNGIILSPVVLRFDANVLYRKWRKGLITKEVYQGSWEEIYPYLTINDLTKGCLADIKRWSGIDLQKLVETARIA